MGAEEVILVDSNVWVYLMDPTAKEHAKVRGSLPKLLAGQEMVMPTVTQLEVVHYIVRRHGEAAAQVLEDFLALPAEIEPLSGGIAVEAARLLIARHSAGIGGRDAALLVIARRRGATLATNDKPLLRLAKSLGIATSNPAA